MSPGLRGQEDEEAQEVPLEIFLLDTLSLRISRLDQVHQVSMCSGPRAASFEPRPPEHRFGASLRTSPVSVSLMRHIADPIDSIHLLNRWQSPFAVPLGTNSSSMVKGGRKSLETRVCGPSHTDKSLRLLTVYSLP